MYTYTHQKPTDMYTYTYQKKNLNKFWKVSAVVALYSSKLVVLKRPELFFLPHRRTETHDHRQTEL